MIQLRLITSKPIGMATLKCKTSKGSIADVPFCIINSNTKPILGLNDCVTLDLVKRINSIETVEKLISEFKDVFHGIGKIPGKHKIMLDPDVTPVINPLDWYQFHYMKGCKKP